MLLTLGFVSASVSTTLSNSALSASDREESRSSEEVLLGRVAREVFVVVWRSGTIVGGPAWVGVGAGIWVSRSSPEWLVAGAEEGRKGAEEGRKGAEEGRKGAGCCGGGSVDLPGWGSDEVWFRGTGEEVQVKRLAGSPSLELLTRGVESTWTGSTSIVSGS